MFHRSFSLCSQIECVLSWIQRSLYWRNSDSKIIHPQQFQTQEFIENIRVVHVVFVMRKCLLCTKAPKVFIARTNNGAHIARARARRPLQRGQRTTLTKSNTENQIDEKKMHIININTKITDGKTYHKWMQYYNKTMNSTNSKQYI